MDRLRVLLAVKTDAELADALGMKPNTFANRKKSGSIPYDEVVAVSNGRGISLDAVFSPEYSQTVTTGSPRRLRQLENVYMAGGSSEATGSAIEVNILAACHAACRQVHGAEFEAQPAAVQIGYAADLYNLSVKMSAQSGGLEHMKRLDKDGMQKLLEVFMRLGWAKRFPPPPPYASSFF